MQLLPSSIKHVVIGLVLLTTLLPLIFILPWAGSRIYTTERDTYLALQTAQNLHIRSIIENELLRIKLILENKADPLVISLGNVSEYKFNVDSLLKKVFLSVPSIHSLLLVSSNAQFIAGLDRHLSINNAYKNHEILKTYYAGGVDINSPFFTIPMHGRVYISAISRDETHENNLTFTIAIPIINEALQVIAVLKASIEPELMWQKVLSEIKPSNTNYYVVDRHGTYVHESKYFQQGEFATQYAIVRKLLEGETWIAKDQYTGVSGEKVFGVSSIVPFVDWGIISEVPVKDVLDPIRENIFIIVGVFIASVFFLVIIALIAIDKIFRPIKQLMNAFKDIERGRYPQLPLSYFSELRVLERGFNSMTSNRQEHGLLLTKALVETEHARGLAEQASQAKSKFLSSMSHELRTPLNAILGFSQLLGTDDNLHQEQKQNVRYIYEAGEHLLELISNVLDLSKVEANQLTLNISEVSLIDVIEASKVILQKVLNENGIELIYDVENIDLVVLNADAFRLKQVLLNLLSNAIKYNKEKGKIIIKCHFLPSKKWRIEVKDTGIGIAKSKVNQLFTPFERLGLENTATEGTGIGLVITKSLIELMGGEIGINSQINEGTTFWFELNGHVKTKKIDTITVKAEKKDQIKCTQPSQKYTVLYVDDDKVNRLIVEKIVEKYGDVQFIGAEDGLDGLECVEKYKPNLILLDIHMLNMSGNELCHIIKQKGIKTPVIAISADLEERAIKAALNVGFDAYLIKPFDTSKLIEIVNQCIKDFNNQCQSINNEVSN